MLHKGKALKAKYQFTTDRPEQEVEARLSKVFGFIFAEIEKDVMQRRLNENEIHQATAQ